MDRYTYNNLIDLFSNKYGNRKYDSINYVNDIITDRIVMFCLENDIRLESENFLGLKNDNFLKFKKEIVNSMISIYGKSNDEAIKIKIKEILNNIDFEVVDVINNKLENINVKSYVYLELRKLDFINIFKKQNTIIVENIYGYINNFFNQLKGNNYKISINNNTKNLKKLIQEIDKYIEKHFTNEEKENKKIEIRTFLTNIILETHNNIIKLNNYKITEIKKYNENILKFISNNIGKEFVETYDKIINPDKIKILYFILKNYINSDFNYKIQDINLSTTNIFSVLDICKDKKNLIFAINNSFGFETNKDYDELSSKNLMFFESIMKSYFGYDKNSIEYYNICEKSGALNLKMQAVPYWCNIMCSRIGINKEILERIKNKSYKDLNLFKFMVDNSDEGKEDSLNVNHNIIIINNKIDISVNDVMNITDEDYKNILNNNNRPTSAFFTILNYYNTETNKKEIEDFLLDKLNELEANIEQTNIQDLINIYFMFRIKEEKQENEIINMFNNSVTFNDIFYGFTDIMNKYNTKYPENNLENNILKKVENELGISEYMQQKRLLNNLKKGTNNISKDKELIL